MNLNIECAQCNTENIVINNKLFFPEKSEKVKIYCSVCSCEITSLETDGWFFVKSKEQYELDLKIDKQQENLKCTDFYL